ISSAVIEVKMARVSILRVVIRRRDAATGVWEFVLPDENIQIPVVINVAAGDRMRPKKILLFADERARRRLKMPAPQALQQKDAIGVHKQKIGDAIAIHIGKKSIP